MKKTYPAKLLLFWEYSVIRWSEVLIQPYKKYAWGFEWNWPVHESVLWLYEYCFSQWYDWLDLSQWKKDIKNLSLVYVSTIPISYWVWSSWALIAALYEKYRLIDTNNTQKLIAHLSSMESYFHWNSSGIDPLTIFLQSCLHKTSSWIKMLKSIDTPPFLLIDTKQPWSTKENVEIFFEKMNDTMFAQSFDDIFVKQTNNCIQAILKRDSERFYSSLKVLSQWTYDNLSEFIPDAFKEQRITGLKKDTHYCKLCGSGGWGFIFSYAYNE